ncbi:MAG TPA: NAD-dependent epimerase/dehydratase family protein [Clostridiales bacterium]|nr:NAD-dependent epimerase/dehydratase family protein [Clostridiales bacterium]
MSEKISVITGATGHIGYALLLKLVERGEKVRILIRRATKQFDGIDCEKVFGDVTEPESLEKAFEGADVVYHLAGLIDINVGQEEKIWEVNFGGTKNVVEACKKCNVRRLVYASSVDAYKPLPDNQEMVELDRFNPDELDGTYAQTKATATNYVLDEVKAGNIDAVVVYPGACIGPYDFKVSNIGEMVRMIINKGFPVSLGFGKYNFVDVRDVADGMIAAAEKAPSGEGYILCGEKISVDDFIHTLCRVCGKKEPKITLGKGLVNFAAPIMEVYYKVSKSTPLLTRYAVRKLVSNCNFSIEKARNELGYNPMSVEQSLKDMVNWIKNNT